MSDVEVIQAEWIAPIQAPPVREGSVVIRDGKILAHGPSKQVRELYPDARVTELGKSVVLPGLVNPHTHLEFSNVERPATPGKFVDWILSLMSQTQADGAAVSDAVKRGVVECLKFGVTTIGDITNRCAITRPILRDSPLRVVSYGEVVALAQRRGLLDERLAGATDCSTESDRLRIGVTPHAPYTVEPGGFRRCVEFAHREGRPIATHLAETPDEAEFLAAGTGEFRRLWDTLGWWDDAVPRFPGGPIRFAKAVGLLDHPTLLAHVNYADDAELAILAQSQASVVYCPRTHTYFGHPPHRWRQMLAAGINVAVGTDSRASSPDLNLVEELRLVRTLAPDVPADDLWPMVTTRAAKAIGLDHVGAIAPGKAADLVAFPAVGLEPLESLLQQTILPTHVWIVGQLQAR
jgi:aminodeoxyfutalosine deaminase